MIAFNLEFFNSLLALIGIAGWSWVWWFGKYKTGHNIRTQTGIILFGVMWVALFVTDTAQNFQPTSLTVVARSLILISMWCCMPLLKDNKPDDEKSAKQKEV